MDTHNSRSVYYLRQLTGYRAFIPAPLPPDPPITYDDDMLNLLSRADQFVGRLDGLTRVLSNPDPYNEVAQGLQITAFDFKDVLERVTIDVSGPHFRDISAVAALDKVVMKFRRDGTTVEVVGLNEASTTIVDKLAIQDKPDAIDLIPSH